MNSMTGATKNIFFHISSGMRFREIIFFQGCILSAKSYFFRDNYFPCFYQNNGFSLTIRDWFPISILITLCLYTSVHRCILWTRDLALVQQRELTLASDIPKCKSKWNNFSFISIWFPKIASLKKYGGEFLVTPAFSVSNKYYILWNLTHFHWNKCS